MLQSVEFGITYSRTNPATGIVEVEKGKAALPFFDVVSFVGRTMPGACFQEPVNNCAVGVAKAPKGYNEVFFTFVFSCYCQATAVLV